MAATLVGFEQCTEQPRVSRTSKCLRPATYLRSLQPSSSSSSPQTRLMRRKSVAKKNKSDPSPTPCCPATTDFTIREGFPTNASTTASTQLPANQPQSFAFKKVLLTFFKCCTLISIIMPPSPGCKRGHNYGKSCPCIF